MQKSAQAYLNSIFTETPHYTLYFIDEFIVISCWLKS